MLRQAGMVLFIMRVIVCLISVLLSLVCVGCVGIRPPSNSPGIKRTVVTTGYCNCGKCTGWRRTWYGAPVYSSGPLKGQRKKIGQTASGKQARHGTIAADTNLYPFGTIMYVPGYGYGVVEDRGSAINGERLDLFFRSHREAQKWGRKPQHVMVWFPDGKR